MRSVNVKFEQVLGLRVAAIIVLGLVVVFVSCTHPTPAQNPIKKDFLSPEAASQALFTALQSHNEQVVMEILGGGKDLVSSGDESEDGIDRKRFAQKYQEMHRLVREPDGSEFLYIGAENWPFPIPLVLRAGEWRFDGNAGKREILFRRIGEDEGSAIDTCHALVLAIKQHGKKTTDNDPVAQYAETLVKTLQPSAGNSPANSEASTVFHGYFFRILSKPLSRISSTSGGFTVVAYPDVYRASGVMTFVVAQDDVVYESDLGPDTVKVAKAINAWRPDSNWYVAE